jgi:hypothetical protein
MDTNATSTYQYWDYLEGDALVCSSRGPSEYQPLCILNRYIFGVAFLFHGSISLYNMRRLQRLQASVADSSVMSLKRQQSSSGGRHQPGQRANIAYFTRLLGTFAVKQLSYGAAQVLSVNGTLHSHSTATGLLGLVLTAIAVAAVMYVALLQLHGAAAFKVIVEIPSHKRERREDWPKRYFFGLLDGIQSVGAPPITIGIWVLRATGLIGSVLFCSVMCGLICYAGTRSTIENLFDRGRTLIRVNHLQQNAGGDIEALHRRRNILKKKLRGLIAFALGILLTTVFVPLSIIVFGSVYSSTQLLIHTTVFNVVCIFVWSHLCMTTHAHVNKKSFKQAKVIAASQANGASTGGASSGNQLEYTVANESGLSVVESEFVKAKGRGNAGEKGGLFSDVSSED